MAKPSGGYTPMMAQFLALKEQHPDVLLLYRMGDFYETFFDDARVAAAELELTLTSRDGGPDGQRIPMAGVPHHALDNYLPRLLAKGFRVAICEQMEDPALAKGLVRREVVRVVTPGTVLETSMLREKQNNYLVAVARGPKGFGLAYCDATTGEFATTELADPGEVRRELERLGAVECLLPLDARALGWVPAPDRRLDPALLDEVWQAALPEGTYVTPRAPGSFAPEVAQRALLQQFGVASLEGFGCAGMALAIAAAGAIVTYVGDTQRAQLPLFSHLRTYTNARCLVLDAATRKHLELTATARDGSFRGSVLHLLDRTRTAMGGRRLRSWLQAPLLERQAIVARQDAVAELVGQPGLLRALGEALAGVRDLERLAGRVAAGTANGRELRALGESLAELPGVAALAVGTRAAPLAALHPAPEGLVELGNTIRATLVEAPPSSVTEGGLIREGMVAEVDALRAGLGDDEAWLAAFEAEERARTGIKSLKVGFTKAFGYYIEVTHANRALVPPEYQRKQTLVNCERFVTPALKAREVAILDGEQRLWRLEHELFAALRGRAADLVPQIQAVGGRLAEVDALQSLAEVALERDYVRPVVDDRPRLHVTGGRHPVVEALLPSGTFVPNDALLDAEGDRLVVLTGPNMAGKSTYMRQLALIVVLAQMGGFVPAASAEVGLVDRIFTRIGAVDDLATGQSTFMVEMNETANILHHATERSLVLLDEIGRGTSTLDGLSIAWAVSEHLAAHVRARTIFATHYHELTGLALSQPGVKSCRVLVEESDDEVVFLRRVVPGGADRSYGIEVARLAGLPASVVGRARQVLSALERNNRLASSLRKGLAAVDTSQAQLSLFEESTP
ncbi:MAG: DNA mismatch repair protein MutS [Candidatus Sericytochromatia bacterium]|nr:DNA mismatch repair protein MutS [Candidatus Sericytochromatia bacterium]